MREILTGNYYSLLDLLSMAALTALLITGSKQGGGAKRGSTKRTR